MKMDMAEQKELVWEIYEAMRDKDLAEAVEIAQAKTGSRLVKLFCESTPELVNSDYRGLIQRLRANDFDLEYLDMGVVLNLGFRVNDE